MGWFGGTEIVVIILLALLFFGGKKIPELARGLGQGIREFNSARASVEDEIKQGMREHDRKELEAKKQSEKEKVKSTNETNA